MTNFKGRQFGGRLFAGRLFRGPDSPLALPGGPSFGGGGVSRRLKRLPDDRFRQDEGVLVFLLR